MTSQPNIQKVFLVGCPRSGTTLLQSFLAAHPNVISAPETHFFADAIGQRAARIFGAKPVGIRQHLMIHYHRLRLCLGWAHRRGARGRLHRLLQAIGQEELSINMPQLFTPLSRMTRFFLQVMDDLAIREGKTCWVEKTPDHLHYIEEIERLVPSASFVHIVRSGPDNIASIYDAAHKNPKLWPAPCRTIDGCVQRWLVSKRDTIRWKDKNNHTVVQYEKLVENPTEVLKSVCRFLQLPFDESMITRRHDTLGNLVRQEETHKAGVWNDVQNRNGMKFLEIFDEAQQAYILDRIHSATFAEQYGTENT